MKTKFSFHMGVYITSKYKNKKPWSLLCFVYLLDSGIIYIKSALHSARYISIQMRKDIGDDKNEDSL